MVKKYILKNGKLMICFGVGEERKITSTAHDLSWLDQWDSEQTGTG